MKRIYREPQTICAVSTPHGVGGISVIRVSGPKSLKIVKGLSDFLPEDVESHRAYYGTLRALDNTEDLDEVIVTYFKKGHSFTGEETLEISCHGSPQICQKILKHLILAGASAAERGEFTYRAFMNGRVDLVQAESVLALIESESDNASRMALRQLKGHLSTKIESIENSVTWLMAHIEAGIDFSTEGLDLVSGKIVSDKLLEISRELSSLVESYHSGRALKDGIRVALAGRPNVGKSSLLNLLLEDDRAIVTSIAGTTRDVISGDTHYSGIKFTFLDTAGIRSQTSDEVEQIGILKSREAHEEADVLLFVYDISEGLKPEDVEILRQLPKRTLFLVGNKVDLVAGAVEIRAILEQLSSVPGFENLTQQEDFIKRNLFFISALDQNTRPTILNEISVGFSVANIQDGVLLSNSRHFENLSKALSNINHCRELLGIGMGSEFLAVDLKEALIAIQETLGKRFDDQVMDRVFKEFCLGK